jgi:VWFA-related protein
VKLLASALASAALLASQSQQPRISERVDVTRLMIDVRVVDDGGDPVAGLMASDFEVRVDGRRVRIDNALWTGDAPVPNTASAEPLASVDLRDYAVGPQNLVVFLFQKDLDFMRIPGMMRMLLDTTVFLDTMRPDDLIAVLSFDSHLNIWTDFTHDRERLRPIFQRGVLLERPPHVEPSGGPSLLARLSVADANRTYSIEKSLQVVAEALQPLRGAKSIVLVGHGFGRYGVSGVTFDDHYTRAAEALLAARASVFSIDITQADYHSLEAGLQLVAQQTGGFFERTFHFPQLALKRLAGVLAGYYVLFVEKPDSSKGWHELEVRLPRHRGNVLARTGYVG